ncbi:MAG TPA: hypothetical protein VMZ90_14695 [Vicinamibacterales bacterium]|nr:hypothetical protein [Vicinamibacterales bacterium]
MTYDETCQLKNRTPVHLHDGTVAHIVVWHRASATVTIAIAGKLRPYTVPCSQLVRDAAGRVHVASDAPATT